MAKQAKRLRADGTTVTLADGNTVQLVFDFDALCELEEMFGTLTVFTARLDAGSKTQIAQTVAKAIAAGLRHLDVPPDVVAVRKMLDSRLINDYLDAINTAFAAAMPERRADEEADPKATGETTPSPGTTSTSSEPSRSGAATASSGA